MLGEEPDVKEQLFEVLKRYAAERDVEALAEALPDILITEEHQQLIDSVRYPSGGSDSNTEVSGHAGVAQVSSLFWLEKPCYI